MDDLGPNTPSGYLKTIIFAVGIPFFPFTLIVATAFVGFEAGAIITFALAGLAFLLIMAPWEKPQPPNSGKVNPPGQTSDGPSESN